MVKVLAQELVSSVAFIAQCALTRLEPIRCGSNLSPQDIWVALEYIEEMQQKLNLLTVAINNDVRDYNQASELLREVHVDSGFRCLDETLQERIAQ
ncbi:hypothetical protein D3C81_1483210 [compost metagenome]